jgi:hypothetical protein
MMPSVSYCKANLAPWTLANAGAWPSYVEARIAKLRALGLLTRYRLSLGLFAHSTSFE